MHRVVTAISPSTGFYRCYLASDNSLHEESKHGEHSQPPILELLDLHDTNTEGGNWFMHQLKINPNAADFGSDGTQSHGRREPQSEITA
jgi:hypothetical protein